MRNNCYLRGDFELLDHPQLEEAADAALDELELRQREVTEAELVQIHRLGFGNVGSLDAYNKI